MDVFGRFWTFLDVFGRFGAVSAVRVGAVGRDHGARRPAGRRLRRLGGRGAPPLRRRRVGPAAGRLQHHRHGEPLHPVESLKNPVKLGKTR